MGEDFIQKWAGSEGNERAKYQSFLQDFCEYLGVEKSPPKGSQPPRTMSKPFPGLRFQMERKALNKRRSCWLLQFIKTLLLLTLTCVSIRSSNTSLLSFMVTKTLSVCVPVTLLQQFESYIHQKRLTLSEPMLAVMVSSVGDNERLPLIEGVSLVEKKLAQLELNLL